MTYKSSAVAETGDRLATIDVDRKVGAAVPPFWGEELGPQSPYIHNVATAEAYLYTKWHLDPFNRLATIHQRYRQTDRTGQTTVQ